MQQNFRMIDVGEKEITRRRAVACGSITVCTKTMKMIREGNSPKGNILAMAEVAGIMAAKNTSQNLPLCHPLLIDSTRIWFDIHEHSVTAYCEVICHGKTGVEMEALFGLNTCLLTIYDLAKAVDPVIEIANIFLQTKEGGKSGKWIHPQHQIELENRSVKKTLSIDLNGLRFAVVTLSDRASKGKYSDHSGPILQDYFKAAQAQEVFYKIIPDEKIALQEIIMKAENDHVDVLALTGGTGISERDITPETVRELSDKELIGFGELQRQHGAKYTNAAWLSRSTAFIVGKTLVILFPGSPKAVTQGLESIGELIPHAIRMIRGEPHHDSEKIAGVDL